MNSSERLPVLDGLRAISIVLVLATHMLPVGPKVLRLNETTGAMGMSLFFALSGFLIASVLKANTDNPEFFVIPLSKILPIAYAYIFVVFLIIHYDPAEIFWTASFLLNYAPDHINSYNGHFWSLCVEVQFYVLIALAVLCAGKRGIWLVWPACLLVTALRIHDGAYLALQTHLRGDEILIGSCVATI